MNVLDGIPDEKLTPEQELELAVAADEDSRATLVLHNICEAFWYAKGLYQSRGLDDGALLSAAYDALACAVKNFTPQGVSFFAYAKPWVRGKVCRAVRANSLGMTEPLPLEEPDDDPTDTEVPVKTRLLAPPAAHFDFHAISIREQWAKIQPIIAPLITDDEQMVLELHFLGEMNLREIADLIGVSRSRVQLVKQEALKKMRNELIERGMFFDREPL